MPVDDSLAGKDPEELTEEEAQLLARQRSLVSHEEYHPSNVHPSDQVVELLNHASVVVRDLAEDDKLRDRYPLLASDAQDTIDGRFPGTAGNGPGTAVRRAEENEPKSGRQAVREQEEKAPEVTGEPV